MFNCLKKKKKVDTKKLAGKFFNIVRIGLDKYAEDEQRIINNKRWSRVRNIFKTINIVKNN
tara:strand:+ start:1421 stop:1603 length:183 start_codon:yes stop_codon:yes gene_type:complete